jgi:cysteine desulfurase
LGAASAIAAAERETDALRIADLRDLFLQIVRERYPDVRVNGSLERRLPGNLSLIFPGCDADRLVGAVQPDVSISTNAACSAGVLQPSHVLLALGLTETDAASTVRIGFGRFNAREDVTRAAFRIAEVACRIRERQSETAAI